MRGEHEAPPSQRRSELGSSPHARGAHEAARMHDGRAGIIPACAGSTRRPCDTPSSWRDHPRMRGEHSSTTPSTMKQIGSSPHARGAPVPAPGHGAPGGIIPACAGSTGGRLRPEAHRGDHPRMRGEHHVRVRPLRGEGGIIPACAGSTMPSGATVMG